MAHLGVNPNPRKKAKQVTGNKTKLSKLAELKNDNNQIDKQQKADNQRFAKQDKLFTKARKLREQLGID